MSGAEVVWRVEDRLRQEVWARRRFGAPSFCPGTEVAVPAVSRDAVPEEARRALLSAAERLLAGEWEVLGVLRRDMVDPDWALDPTSGWSFPGQELAFRVEYRSRGDGRNVKAVWELSRHHHLSVLAAAWWLTGDERYATRAAEHLRSWWGANPVLTGVNWNSGIEIGIRLISWVWTRRLLEGWAGAPGLFEENPVARHQVYWHQRWLAAFPSRGSSANNHVVAEAAGQLVASCAFAWFRESGRWREDASALFCEQLARNTFESGLNREQAFEYLGLVTELGLVAAAEASAAGGGLGAETHRVLCRSLDALASVLDVTGRPPRYGDGDDGRALVTDDPGANRWTSLLTSGAALFGRQPWWPAGAADVRSLWLGALGGSELGGGGQRAERRRSHFPDAGLTILRAAPDSVGEVWCRADGGPHGFGSIAAHAHADALSIEVRIDGIEVLADPGTYCYHSEPAFRRYFRSTLGHSTIELDGADQSAAGGPFMWTRHAQTQVHQASTDGPGPLVWSASHDGYGRLAAPAVHRRRVCIEAVSGQIEITDEIETAGHHQARLAFHLGPTVSAELSADRAVLRWAGAHGEESEAVLVLPAALTWRGYRGSTDPVLGWYSAGFGRRQPATTLVGSATLGRCELRTLLRPLRPTRLPIAIGNAKESHG